MNRLELAEPIRHGKSSGVELKRAVWPERLARETAVLLNHEGGHVLPGMEDDGAVTGPVHPPKRIGEQVMEAVRTHGREQWDGVHDTIL